MVSTVYLCPCRIKTTQINNIDRATQRHPKWLPPWRSIYLSRISWGPVRRAEGSRISVKVACSSSQPPAALSVMMKIRRHALASAQASVGSKLGLTGLPWRQEPPLCARRGVYWGLHLVTSDRWSQPSKKDWKWTKAGYAYPATTLSCCFHVTRKPLPAAGER